MADACRTLALARPSGDRRIEQALQKIRRAERPAAPRGMLQMYEARFEVLVEELYGRRRLLAVPFDHGLLQPSGHFD